VVRRTLSIVMAYAICISLFFLLIEVSTILSGRLPEHIETLRFLYVGLEGHAPLVPLMWLSLALMIVAAVMLLTPRVRARDSLAAVAAVFVLAGLGLDKGFSFVFGGFVPTPLGTVPSYVPTLPEWTIVAGIWAIGALLVAISWRVTLAARAGT
jgi:molybdopterin-containing oxidoreductase family membrane subunit